MNLRIERLLEIIWSNDQEGCLIIIIMIKPLQKSSWPIKVYSNDDTRFNQIVFKLAMNKQSGKGFLLASNFVPKELYASAKRLYIQVSGERLHDHCSSGITLPQNILNQGSFLIEYLVDIIFDNI